MNWHLKITYISVSKNLPNDVPVSFGQCVITDDISKFEFPKLGEDHFFKGFPFKLSSIEIVPTDYIIIV